MIRIGAGSKSVSISSPVSKKSSATLSCWSALKNARRWPLTKTIDVEIYGQRFAIRGEADEGYIRRLASFVDSQMRSLAEGMNTTTPSKLAVLTAINLAHQLFEVERKRAQGDADVERRMTSLMESIEEQVPTSLFR
ncbi:MAG: cell division protein ZapA [Nitrospira sp.]|nr:MAG: cell division protein ZapA [Nitrospira sp.]